MSTSTTTASADRSLSETDCDAGTTSTATCPASRLRNAEATIWLSEPGSELEVAGVSHRKLTERALPGQYPGWRELVREGDARRSAENEGGVRGTVGKLVATRHT
jgi:hypothetical protein